MRRKGGINNKKREEEREKEREDGKGIHPQEGIQFKKKIQKKMKKEQ
jgi:hypothetical protein